MLVVDDYNYRLQTILRKQCHGHLRAETPRFALDRESIRAGNGSADSYPILNVLVLIEMIPRRSRISNHLSSMTFGY